MGMKSRDRVRAKRGAKLDAAFIASCSAVDPPPLPQIKIEKPTPARAKSQEWHLVNEEGGDGEWILV